MFAIEVLVCPRCTGPRRILDTVTEPEAVRRLLGALGLAAQPPPGRPVTASGPTVDRGIEAVILGEAGRVTSPSSHAPHACAQRPGYAEMAGILERAAPR